MGKATLLSPSRGTSSTGVADRRDTQEVTRYILDDALPCYHPDGARKLARSSGNAGPSRPAAVSPVHRLFGG